MPKKSESKYKVGDILLNLTFGKTHFKITEVINHNKYKAVLLSGTNDAFIGRYIGKTQSITLNKYTEDSYVLDTDYILDQKLSLLED